ncbi:MAG TPA: tetratricopeptide repeat protein, partial [Thermoplasmata archaeon]|nr:tetratricopeptide repeat protein [Thermoplasmata archaeon]
FVPLTRNSLNTSTAIPAASVSLAPTQVWGLSFDNEDGLGAVRYKALIVTLTFGAPGTRLEVQVTKGSSQSSPVPITSTSLNRPRPFDIDTTQFYEYRISFRNPSTSEVRFTYAADREVFPALFSLVPGIAVALAIASLLFILILRPRREQFKQAAIYSGDFQTRVGSGERLYSEYSRMRPAPAEAAPAGNPSPAASAPVPIVSPYTGPPVIGNPVVRAPDPAPAPRPVVQAQPAPVVAAPRMPTPAEMFAEGASLFSAGEYELAIHKFDEVRKLDPRHTRALLGKGEALLRLGRANDALQAYDEILRHDRGNLDALLGTAAAYSADRRWRDVIDLADTFLAMRPGDPEMLVYRGDAKLALGKRSEAQISYEAALQKRPGDPSIVSRVERAKVDISALQSRALMASASGNLDQAIALFDEVLKVEPENANSLVGKSVALRRAGRVDDALAALNGVLARQPGHGGALLNKGRILEERGDLDDALEAYDKLIELNPGDADAWVAQGDVLAKMGRDDDARKSYQEALRLAPGDEDMQGKISSLENSRAEEGALLRELFQIKGVGPAKARALRDAGFKSAEDFRKASEDDLMKVRGVTRKVANDILEHFKSGSPGA